MTGARINEVFKGFGKFIRLADVGAADASGVKAHMVATLQQFGQQAGGADYYDDLMTVVVPLETRVQPTVAALDRLATQAKAAVENYVRVIGSELGQPATATMAAILDGLKAHM